MKKTLAILFTIFFIAGSAFAQSEVSALPDEDVKVDLSMKEYVPENQHLDKEDKAGKVRIQYIPSPLKKSLSLLFYPYLVLLYSKTIEKEH